MTIFIVLIYFNHYYYYYYNYYHHHSPKTRLCRQTPSPIETGIRGAGVVVIVVTVVVSVVMPMTSPKMPNTRRG